MLKEVFVGSISFSTVTYLAMDRRIIDTARGVSMSEVQVPHSKQRATITNLTPALVIFTSRRHYIFFEAYFNSFVAILSPISRLTRRAEPLLIS